MPLLVFNFKSSNTAGEVGPFTSSIVFRHQPPANTRFYLKSVNATDPSAFATCMRYVELNIPKLMGDNDRVLFSEDIVTVNGTAVSVVANTSTNPGLRYYLTDPYPTPFQIHVYPNLCLGKHTIHSQTMEIILTPRTDVATLAKCSAFTVVLEYE